MRRVIVPLLLTVMATGASAQVLGPKDGADLPRVDLVRVKVGDPAPDFTLEALSGPPITLSQYRGKQNVILVFYRGYW
jgi:peroxiredoxin (alkyl hydroperoxide reductase subunit C)